jgi:hypothetical protein
MLGLNLMGEMSFLEVVQISDQNKDPCFDWEGGGVHPEDILTKYPPLVQAAVLKSDLSSPQAQVYITELPFSPVPFVTHTVLLFKYDSRFEIPSPGI